MKTLQYSGISIKFYFCYVYLFTAKTKGELGEFFSWPDREVWPFLFNKEIGWQIADALLSGFVCNHPVFLCFNNRKADAQGHSAVSKERGKKNGRGTGRVHGVSERARAQ